MAWNFIIDRFLEMPYSKVNIFHSETTKITNFEDVRTYDQYLMDNDNEFNVHLMYPLNGESFQGTVSEDLLDHHGLLTRLHAWVLSLGRHSYSWWSFSLYGN